jgi:hypothetical protein
VISTLALIAAIIGLIIIASGAAIVLAFIVWLASIVISGRRSRRRQGGLNELAVRNGQRPRTGTVQVLPGNQNGDQ